MVAVVTTKKYFFWMGVIRLFVCQIPFTFMTSFRCRGAACYRILLYFILLFCFRKMLIFQNVHRRHCWQIYDILGVHCKHTSVVKLSLHSFLLLGFSLVIIKHLLPTLPGKVFNCCSEWTGELRCFAFRAPWVAISLSRSPFYCRRSTWGD